jgi:hypothetical protein
LTRYPPATAQVVTGGEQPNDAQFSRAALNGRKYSLHSSGGKAGQTHRRPASHVRQRLSQNANFIDKYFIKDHPDKGTYRLQDLDWKVKNADGPNVDSEYPIE